MRASATTRVADALEFEIAERLRQDTDQLLRSAQLLQFAVPLGFGVVSVWYANEVRVAVWVSLTVLATGGSMALLRRVAAAGGAPQVLYQVAAGMQGVAWGLKPWITRSLSDTGWLLIALSLALVMIGNGLLWVRLPRAKLAFQLPILVIGAGGLIVLGGRPAAAAGTIMAIAFLVDIGFSRRARSTAASGVETAIRNERLAGELVALNRELEYKATRDELTGLHNRSTTQRIIHDALESEPGAAVAMVDIDRFKMINDLLGHDVGDRVLSEAANRLAGVIDGHGTVIRQGGDEFLIVLPGVVEVEAAVDVVGSALLRCSEPLVDHDRPITVTASAGLAIVTEAAELEAALRSADVALCAAKRTGGDRVQSFDSQLARRHQMAVEAQVRVSRALDAGDVQGWFQPVVDIRSGRTVGFECLARWVRHDEVVTAGEFVDVVARAGRTLALVDAVLASAASLLAELPECDTRLAINVPPALLSSVADRAVTVLGPTGLRRITFELIEGDRFGDLGRLRATVDRVRDAGARVHLDDFGVAFSSLNLLIELAVDGIKIDRSFTQGIDSDPAVRAVVISLVRAARDLGIDVIAEGIESADQESALRQLGICLMQGYRYSPAVPIAEAIELARRPWSARV